MPHPSPNRPIARLVVLVTLVASAVLLIVLSFGGDGDDGGGDGAAALPGTNSLADLSTRDMPNGLTVRVCEDLAKRTATTRTVTIALDGPVADVASIEVWVGNAVAPGIAGVMAVTAGGADRYQATVPVMNSVTAGARVWLRITTKDGSVVESGADDFPLA